MFFENFLSAFGRDWSSPFLSAVALTDGRASLKRHLSLASAVKARSFNQFISFSTYNSGSDEEEFHVFLSKPNKASLQKRELM